MNNRNKAITPVGAGARIQMRTRIFVSRSHYHPKGAIVFKERRFLKGHIEKDEVTESYHFRDTLLELLPRKDFPLKIHPSLEHF